MITLNTSRNDMGVAWMLKHDGTAIPVTIHIYGAIGDVDSNVEAAIWMLKYNPYSKLEEFLRRYVGYVACNEVPYTEDDTVFRANLKKALLALPFNPGQPVKMSKEQTVDFFLKLVENLTISEIYDLGDTIDDNSGDFVCKDLNETFIRVRMNNEYNAASYNGVGYFRIGSTYKDWTNPIYMFVADHPKIKTIVVERDAESDGEEGSHKRRVMIDNMSREEFLSATKLPFLGSKHTEGIFKSCYDVISQGTYSDLSKIRANSSRVNRVCETLRRENLSRNYVRMDAPWASKPMNR